ncbi:hypothetical protein HHK36_005484 [Tetracentron sinense]|uniref:Bulb-type lectin domain-containing protein n=1 Tax=Tetracentron sinense TaxID=13715 RepID=A0A835DMD2_TETSI|nr:hypothetical protein HHK36_005484 [Tetracentron sinense]
MASSPFPNVTDTIKPGQSISKLETIISAGGEFELGFFSPGKSRNYFVGIWYKKVNVQTVVWVANREQPLTSPSGILTINMEGNLVVLDGNNSYPVSDLSSVKNTSATLLDSGNLILRDSKSQILWQSFDYPSDTFLPGMRIGYNKKTGKAWSLTSWRSEEDPAPGVFSLKMDPEISMQLLVTNGSNNWRGWKSRRSGNYFGRNQDHNAMFLLVAVLSVVAFMIPCLSVNVCLVSSHALRMIGI